MKNIICLLFSHIIVIFVPVINAASNYFMVENGIAETSFINHERSIPTTGINVENNNDLNGNGDNDENNNSNGIEEVDEENNNLNEIEEVGEENNNNVEENNNNVEENNNNVEENNNNVVENNNNVEENNNNTRVAQRWCRHFSLLSWLKAIFEMNNILEFSDFIQMNKFVKFILNVLRLVVIYFVPILYYYYFRNKDSTCAINFLWPICYVFTPVLLLSWKMLYLFGFIKNKSYQEMFLLNVLSACIMYLGGCPATYAALMDALKENNMISRVVFLPVIFSLAVLFILINCVMHRVKVVICLNILHLISKLIGIFYVLMLTSWYMAAVEKWYDGLETDNVYCAVINVLFIAMSISQMTRKNLKVLYESLQTERNMGDVEWIPMVPVSGVPPPTYEEAMRHDGGQNNEEQEQVEEQHQQQQQQQRQERLNVQQPHRNVQLPLPRLPTYDEIFGLDRVATTQL